MHGQFDLVPSENSGLSKKHRFLPKKVISYFLTANVSITQEVCILNKTCFWLLMAKAAHYGAAFTLPNNIIFMAADTFFMKGH